MDDLSGSSRIHDANTIGFGVGKFEIRGSHTLLKRSSLPLEPVGAIEGRASEGVDGVDVENERDVRLQPTASDRKSVV